MSSDTPENTIPQDTENHDTENNEYATDSEDFQTSSEDKAEDTDTELAFDDRESHSNHEHQAEPDDSGKDNTSPQDSVPDPNNGEQDSEKPDLSIIGEIPVLLTLEVGDREMTISELSALQVGSIVTLQHKECDPLDVKVNGVLVAKGEVVLAGDYYGVRILSLTPSGCSDCSD